jgi:hypothetical protein
MGPLYLSKDILIEFARLQDAATTNRAFKATEPALRETPSLSLATTERTRSTLGATTICGATAPRSEISDSGLWNINHVGEQYDTAFQDQLAAAVEETTGL